MITWRGRLHLKANPWLLQGAKFWVRKKAGKMSKGSWCVKPYWECGVQNDCYLFCFLQFSVLNFDIYKINQVFLHPCWILYCKARLEWTDQWHEDRKSMAYHQSYGDGTRWANYACWTIHFISWTYCFMTELFLISTLISLVIKLISFCFCY